MRVITIVIIELIILMPIKLNGKYGDKEDYIFY